MQFIKYIYTDDRTGLRAQSSLSLQTVRGSIIRHMSQTATTHQRHARRYDVTPPASLARRCDVTPSRQLTVCRPVMDSETQIYSYSMIKRSNVNSVITPYGVVIIDCYRSGVSIYRQAIEYSKGSTPTLVQAEIEAKYTLRHRDKDIGNGGLQWCSSINQSQLEDFDPYQQQQQQRCQCGTSLSPQSLLGLALEQRRQVRDLQLSPWSRNAVLEHIRHSLHQHQVLELLRKQEPLHSLSSPVCLGVQTPQTA